MRRRVGPLMVLTRVAVEVWTRVVVPAEVGVVVGVPLPDVVVIL